MKKLKLIISLVVRLKSIKFQTKYALINFPLFEKPIRKNKIKFINIVFQFL